MRHGPARSPAPAAGQPCQGQQTTWPILRVIGTASGTSVAVLGALSGQFLLLGADTPGGAIWFIAPGGQAGTLKVAKASGADLTRDIGIVTLAGHLVPDDHVLDVGTDELRSLLAVLFAAEAVGAARWCQQAGLDYVKVREQFGRPVGAFQAIKHKCARMFAALELLSAAAWDAASAAGQDRDQAGFAAAAAAVSCLPAAVKAAPDGERRRMLAEAGLVSPHYPRPYGLAADAARR